MMLKSSARLRTPVPSARGRQQLVVRAFTDEKTGSSVSTKSKSVTKPDACEKLLSKLKDKQLLRTQGYVNGEWTAGSSSGKTFEVYNPATGEVLAKLPHMKGNDTRSAISAAESAWAEWRNTTAKERSAVLKRWYQLVKENAEDLAIILTSENGKPLEEARTEIAAGAASLEWVAEECKRVTGEVLETISRDRRMITLKQPVGVVGAITPWNFPMGMITRKVAPALSVGCTVVLKPAELTPLSALALAELAERAGLPPGCFNIVFGDAKAIGEELTSSEVVRKIAFTGSTAVGKQLAAAACGTVKRISLELGGNAPFIVFDDADLDRAADGVIASGLRNAGQTCVCANRVFVQESVHDKLAEKIAERVKKLKVGNGLEEGTKIGPLISPGALKKVEEHVEDAKSKGAKLLTGGGKPEMSGPLSGGTFFQPTVITHATKDMRCFQEETFGPLLPLFKFKEEAEVVKLANTTQYGLAGYFYTQNLARAWRVAEGLEFGMIGLNEESLETETAPFGGVKESGLGREEGQYGLMEFLEVKYVCMGLGKQ